MNKTKAYLLVLAIAILLFLSVVMISAKSDKTGKIEQKVLDSLEKEGKINVIVILKEPAKSSFKSEKQRILARAEIKQEVSDNLGKEKVKQQFSSINAFSARLTADDIAKLEREDNVAFVYYDIPVKAFLQDSVPLINATKTWSLQSNGINLTGKGETICIIDTGVDYTHPGLGNCTPVRYEINGTIENYTLESAHNYTNNFDYTWNITKPGYSKVGVHFVNISTEATYDYVYILDGGGKIVGTYSGAITDFWSPSVQGDTIYIRLKSDESIAGYGFYIDQIINGTTNKTYDWSNCSKVVGGWDTINSDPDLVDDNGHGTHVSGIAAANGTIKGVALESKIISIKALDASGNGVTGDVAAGIEWCTNRSADFNISVISMSLGGGLYSTYCDVNDSVMAAAINSAVAKNISVIAAAGNSGSTTAISIPACIQNATPIGSIRKDDSSIDYNRNSLVQLLAPGYNINSTQNGGGYTFLSGTSMATPHAAGAFAIINQYLRLNSKTRTPQQIESALNSTGKLVYDSGSGLNFSRINLYGAIVSLDFIAPNVTLAGPADNYSALDTTSILFEYNVTDNKEINSCALIINGAITDYNSSSINTSATNTISKTLGAGDYNWSINCSDSSGNTGNSSTRSISVNSTYTPPTSSGGGGGGGAQIQTYSASESALVAGYNVALGKGSKIKFSRNYDSHTLTVDSIGTNFAGITIASSPISFALMNGESREIDFDSDEHNDLLVKLESIEGSKANITLKSIYEKIAEENFPLPEQTKSEQHAYTIQEKTETWSKTNLDNFTIKLSLIAGMIVAVTVLFWYFHKQYNQSIKLHLHTHIFHKRQK